MPWAKLSDSFWSDPKIDNVSLAAVGLYSRGLSYCGQHVAEEGRIPERVAHFMSQGEASLVEELVGAGLWIEGIERFQVNGWLKHNDSAEQVELKRKQNRERAERYRAKQRDEADAAPDETPAF